MTKQNKRKKGACVVACALLAVGCMLGAVPTFSTYSIFAQQQKQAEEMERVETFLSHKWVMGDTATLPNLQENGKPLQRVLYAPDGNGYVSKNITFDKAGSWALSYFGDGTQKTYSFVVLEPMYEVNGQNSTVYVGKPSDVTPYGAGGKAGVYAKVYDGESVQYNTLIDLSNSTKEDTLIEFATMPEQVNQADVDKVVFTLTDAENPDNQLTLMVKFCNPDWYGADGAWANNCTYVMAGATGQEGHGLEYKPWDANQMLVYEGVPYVAYHEGFYKSWYGTFADFSVAAHKSWGADGSINYHSVGTDSMRLSIDYASKKVYVNDSLITDLDDPLLQTTLWGGFETGKCYLSVSGANYNKVAMNVFITELAGDTVLDKTYVEYTEKPTITLVDFDETTVESFHLNKKFIIPSAIARSAVGQEVDVQLKGVFTAYGTGTQAVVPIKDGGFIPTQKREYSIVYHCVDKCGNVTEKIFTRPAVQSNEKIHLDFSTEMPSAKVGEEITLPLPTVQDFVGFYNMRVCVEKDGTSQELCAYSSGDKVKSPTFQPMEAGPYKVVYTYSDSYFIGESYSQELVVQAGGEAFYVDQPEVPKYVIKNALYKLNVGDGYVFTTGKGVLTEPSVYLTENGDIQGQTALSDNTFTYTGEKEFVYLTYVLGASKRTYPIPVVDVGYKTAEQKAEKYFDGYEGEPILDKEMGIAFKVKNGDNGYSLSFVNAVQVEKFYFGFRLPEGATNKKVNVYLTDAADDSNVLKISYHEIDGKVFGLINDEMPRDLKNTTLTEPVVFGYVENTGMVNFGGAASGKVFNKLNGAPWTGFIADSVWLRIELEDADEENASIYVEKINNQQFYAYKKFRNINETPEIFQKTVSGNIAYGVEVTVPRPIVKDVFSPTVSATLKVFMPNGDYAKTTDGVELNGKQEALDAFSLKMDSYGSYFVSYYLDDELGGINDYKEFNINVVDTKAPEVSIGEHASNVAFGSKITIADIEIKDDLTDDKDIVVYVLVERPDQSVFSWSQRAEFGEETYIYGGEYTIWYYVYDKAGNATLAKYTVMVM